jgi:hypothetical protein
MDPETTGDGCELGDTVLTVQNEEWSEAVSQFGESFSTDADEAFHISEPDEAPFA